MSKGSVVASVARVCGALGLAGLVVSSAQGAVVYDHMIASADQISTAGVEYAEYVTLSGGATTVTSARLRMGLSAIGADAGTITLSFYADNAGQPGSLLGSVAHSIAISSVAQLEDFTGLSVAVPASLWVSSRFDSTGSSIGGVRMTTWTTSVGSVDSTRAIRSGGAGPWTLESTSHWMELQLTAVPTPGAASLLGVAGMLAARRRRA